MYKWNCMSKGGDLYETTEDIAPEYRNLIRPYMFPPEESVARELKLERCIRILPHHQNTGGFFIAVIHKKPLPGSETTSTVQATETEADTGAAAAADGQKSLPEQMNKMRVMKAPAAKRVVHMFDENPFTFMDETNQLIKDWPKIKEFYGVRDDFPCDQMMTRNRKGENVKNVYFVSKQIRDLTVNNQDRFKFINMGVPLFSRYELKDSCNVELRVCQEVCSITYFF
jgi:tRNA (cytosine34-C5)-methyltransferase